MSVAMLLSFMDTRSFILATLEREYDDVYRERFCRVIPHKVQQKSLFLFVIIFVRTATTYFKSILIICKKETVIFGI